MTDSYQINTGSHVQRYVLGEVLYGEAARVRHTHFAAQVTRDQTREPRPRSDVDIAVMINDQSESFNASQRHSAPAALECILQTLAPRCQSARSNQNLLFS
jgi:hypothetical protein